VAATPVEEVGVKKKEEDDSLRSAALRLAEADPLVALGQTEKDRMAHDTKEGDYPLPKPPVKSHSMVIDENQKTLGCLAFDNPIRVFAMKVVLSR
jgi:hypothetical protein